eukprot:Mycagemm_TRINITY_DN10368_c5_g6::TRINITY_DN10368_c5_g6_i1::g.720::m.720 type:complete len:131 gc:universal TRINITY_DN10368_c5_g6_i1:404-12(-)
MRSLLHYLHGGALVIEAVESAGVGVELEAATTVLFVVEEHDGGARADADRRDLIVAAKILKVGLALLELPDVAQELAVLVEPDLACIGTVGTGVSHPIEGGAHGRVAHELPYSALIPCLLYTSPSPRDTR